MFANYYKVSSKPIKLNDCTHCYFKFCLEIIDNQNYYYFSNQKEIDHKLNQIDIFTQFLSKN